MKSILYQLFGLVLVAFITVSQISQAEQVPDLQEFYSPRNNIHLGTERRLSVEGRDLAHMHIHSTPLYGNSTGLMYYYVTVFLGSHR